jgi:hypothetical protein
LRARASVVIGSHVRELHAQRASLFFMTIAYMPVSKVRARGWGCVAAGMHV